jgi:hypothetical protein
MIGEISRSDAHKCVKFVFITVVLSTVRVTTLITLMTQAVITYRTPVNVNHTAWHTPKQNAAT